MKITRILVLVLAACLLQGCAQQKYVLPVEPGIVRSAATPKGGYLAVMESYSVSNDWAVSIEHVVFRLRRTDGGGDYLLQDPRSWEEDAVAARAAFPANTRVVSGLLLAELPPGEYEINAFHAIGLEPWRQLLNPVKHDVPISVRNTTEPLTSRFRIEAGRTTYIGEVLLFLTLDHYRVSFVDHQSHDLPLLFQRYPQVDSSRVDVHVPSHIEPRPGRDGVMPPMQDTRYGG